MKRIPILCAAVISLPGAALADACMDEFRAVFDSQVDADKMAPYRMREEVTSAAGDPIRSIVVEVVSSTHLLSISPGAPLYMQYGATLYSATDLAGPWTKVADLPPKPEAAYRKQHGDRVANLRDVTCLGPVTRDGVSFTAYGWTTQTTPLGDGTYFGESSVGYFDRQTGRLILSESTGSFGHWAPEPSTDMIARSYEYDPSLTLPIPE